MQEATSIPTYSRPQRKKKTDLFPSKILSTSLPVQVAWNTPSSGLPAPKPHSMWELTSLQPIFSLPPGFPQDQHETELMLSVRTPVIDCREFWEGIRDVLKMVRPGRGLRDGDSERDGNSETPAPSQNAQRSSAEPGAPQSRSGRTELIDCDIRYRAQRSALPTVGT